MYVFVVSKFHFSHFIDRDFWPELRASKLSYRVRYLQKYPESCWYAVPDSFCLRYSMLGVTRFAHVSSSRIYLVERSTFSSSMYAINLHFNLFSLFYIWPRTYLMYVWKIKIFTTISSKETLCVTIRVKIWNFARIFNARTIVSLREMFPVIDLARDLYCNYGALCTFQGYWITRPIDEVLSERVLL